MSDQNTISNNVLDVIGKRKDAMGITSSPSTTLDITIDITEDSKAERVLGQMVFVVVEEDGRSVLVIGQIISIETKNRWHEDPSFKGVIKRHGKLPHLSGNADNRIATISVQACYDLGTSEPKGHILGTSPSTGEKIRKMDNELMQTLMKKHEKALTYVGKVYGTNVDLPFWFKHFDKNDEKNQELGAGDAYHIGVFGKTGSGKTVTASYMILGYAKNKNNLNILVLDPQGQFYNDKGLIQPEGSFADKIKETGMTYQKFRILEDLYLPASYELFANLLSKTGFIKSTFNILSDRELNACEAIAVYLEELNRNSQGQYANFKRLSDDQYNIDLMKQVLKKFIEVSEEETKGKVKITYNTYIDMIYSQPGRKDQLIDKLKTVLSNETQLQNIFEKCWKPVSKLFANSKTDGNPKSSIESVIDLVTTREKKGNFIILDLSERKGNIINENLQALFIKIIENKIKEKGEEFYSEGDEKVNCLIVMDEAHRFISQESNDPQIIDLTKEIIDSVRTTRKYGIGYMFITQTIESLDKEILLQTRIYAFGYGLTTGPELRKVSEIVNNDQAIQLYKSFIDPSSNKKFPFMFFGPISPLSFTGSPLFVEVYTDFSNFK